MKPISLTLVTNLNNDLPGCKTTIYTAFKYGDFTKINIITTGNNESIEIIRNFCNCIGIELNIISIDKSKQLDHISSTKIYAGLSHITNDAYNKFYVFKLINEDTLYVDTDILFTKKFNIQEFINLTEGVYFVKNGYLSPSYWLKKYSKIFENKNEVSKHAFNSGLFYINISNNKKIKEEYFNKLVFSLKNNKFDYLDQAHFNLIFKNTAKYLHLKYNWPYHIRDNKLVAKTKPSIIHFAGPKKPWISNNVKRDKFSKKWIKEFREAERIYE